MSQNWALSLRAVRLLRFDEVIALYLPHREALDVAEIAEAIGVLTHYLPIILLFHFQIVAVFGPIFYDFDARGRDFGTLLGLEDLLLICGAQVALRFELGAIWLLRFSKV